MLNKALLVRLRIKRSGGDAVNSKICWVKRDMGYNSLFPLIYKRREIIKS